MSRPSRVKLSIVGICLALACAAPASQAKSRNTQAAPPSDSTVGGLLDGSLLDTHSPLGNGHGPHRKQTDSGGLGGGGGGTDPPPPVTCTDNTVTTSTVVTDPITTPSVGNHHRFHGSSASSPVVTESLTTTPTLARNSVVTDSLVSGSSGLQRFHHKKKNKGGGSGGSDPPPPTSGGSPCTPDPPQDCASDPTLCNNPGPRAAPEPGTLALVGLGLGAVAAIRRRTQKASS